MGGGLMPGAFLYQDRVAAGLVTSFQAAVPSMPISNVQEPQPRRRARLVGYAGASVMTVDFLEGVFVDCAALISTTIGAGDSVQMELSNHPLLLSLLADTGVIAAEASDEGMGNVIITLPAPVKARYMRISVYHAAASIDVGLLVAGALWRVARGTSYGIQEGRVMLDRRDRNPFTGAEFPVPAIANPRLASFTLPSLSTSEARNQHREMVRLLGAARDALWIPELGDSMAERNRRALWGAVNVPGEDAAISRDSLPLSSRAFRIIERL